MRKRTAVDRRRGVVSERSSRGLVRNQQVVVVLQERGGGERASERANERARRSQPSLDCLLKRKGSASAAARRPMTKISESGCTADWLPERREDGQTEEEAANESRRRPSDDRATGRACVWMCCTAGEEHAHASRAFGALAFPELLWLRHNTSHRSADATRNVFSAPPC